MYKFCRVALTVAVVEFVYGIGVAMLAGWPWSFIGVMGAITFQKLKKGRLLWGHGTARWATESELRKAGMVDGDNGLMIGRLGDSRGPTWQQVAPALIDWQLDPKTACAEFLSPLAIRKRRCVRLSKAVHTAVFAPTGVGKGTSLIIPWLLWGSDESAVVVDFKGENAAMTAEHRRARFGHRIELLDPWHVVTNNPSRLNPLDFIAKGSRDAIDECRDIAEQLVIKSGEEKEPHWNEAAEMWIAAAAAAVVEHAQPQERSLQAVCDVLSNPDKIARLLAVLCASDSATTHVRLGGQLAHFKSEELASTLTSANRHLRFLSTPAVMESTSSSSFDPSELRNGRMTVYLIMPPEHMRAAAGLMRLWVGTLLRSVVRGGLQRA